MEIEVNYLIVVSLSPYNIIMGRPTINVLGEIISTWYLVLKYPLPNEKIGMVRGDQQSSQKGYKSSMAVEKEEPALVGVPFPEALDADTDSWDPILDR